MIMRLKIVIAALLLLTLPIGNNACSPAPGTAGRSAADGSLQNPADGGSTSGNPMLPLAALSFAPMRVHTGCLKGLQVRRVDGSVHYANIVEVPTSIRFTGTEFGSFDIPPGEYDRIGVVFGAHCMTESNEGPYSYIVENDNGRFVSPTSFVMRFDGRLVHPDPQGRRVYLDMSAAIDALELVSDAAEVAPAGRSARGVFQLY